MGFWQRLFGDGDRRPPGEQAGELREGKRHGRWIEKDGDFLVERHYQVGVVHGPSRTWHRDGHLWEKATFVDGAKDGVMLRFGKDGAAVLQATYRAGKLHGPLRELNPDGSVKSEREYRDDERHAGLFEVHGSRGNLISRATYVDGAPHGMFEKYHFDERVEERGTYVAGKKHGAFELGDLEGNVWRGSFDHDVRVGVWELARANGSSARGPYPHGTWTVRDKTGAEAQFELADGDDVMRWIVLVEHWLARWWDFGLRAWPEAQRARGYAWIAAHAVAEPRQRSTTGYNSPRAEAADRDALVAATGDVVLPDRKPRREDDDDYMKHWHWDRALRVVSIATIELPALVILGSEGIDPRDLVTCHPGAYDVLGVELPGARLYLPGAIVRRSGVAVTTWRYWGAAGDSDFVLIPLGARFEDPIAWDEPPADAFGAREWIRPGRTSDGQQALWITNPSGNGIRAFEGLAADRTLAALMFQLY